MSLKKLTIFDFDFIAANSVEEVVRDIIDTSSAGNDYDFLITPNAYQVVHFNDKRNAGLKEFYKHSSYILPDGMPIVWISKLFKNSLQKRLTGSDLFPVLWNEIKKRNKAATLVLPTNSIAELFQKDHTTANCFIPEVFAAGDEGYISTFSEKVADGIVNNKSRYVFLGLGFPKQEILARQIAEKLSKKGYEAKVLFLLLGASFEFYFGLKNRAPVFFQRTGLEWLYRFAQEPARLWKRYTIDNVRFLFIAIGELFKHR